MASTSSLVFVGVAPHPPIMVPEVGGEAIREVEGSISAMGELTRRVVESGAETVVLISPHAPLEARAFVAYRDAQLAGSFAPFRAPEAQVSAPLDAEMLDALAREAGREGFEIAPLEGYALDHGTAVPLYFLLRNGWRGSVVALGYSFLSNDDHLRLGECLRGAADAVNRRIAFVASGDLSHRLTREAPAGYNPDAHLFDEQVVASLRECAPGRIAEIDQSLRRLAGECGYRSMLVAVGASRGLRADCEVLHYEAPFGVGYMVAQLARGGAEDQTGAGGDAEAEPEKDPARVGLDEKRADQNSPRRDDEARASRVAEGAGGEELPKLARRVVESFVRGERLPPVGEIADAPVLNQPSACFVSIKTLDGSLRGCIGTIEPTRDSLAEELIANAVSAATRDPRFAPVAADELAHLRYSVDILSEPEPASFEELDPKNYGVIVEDERGTRRGLLLPDIEGVETAAQQLQIAARKAGISPHEPVRLYRFRVERFREQGFED
ncbi:MAG: AmmeMemoRadiSam system protein A [Acidobacteria bacterium]|nr:AmmeMemoRadiSam system protein A [Acidobacteriota bacterium]